MYPCHAVIVAMQANNGQQKFFIGHTDKVRMPFDSSLVRSLPILFTYDIQTPYLAVKIRWAWRQERHVAIKHQLQTISIFKYSENHPICALHATTNTNVVGCTVDSDESISLFACLADLS